ncbi:MarC family protein [Acidomonas methanolica]|uniref:MarC family protein n=1 Tax=Acidomonas methanolica TaxID=437 RepID=UPI00211A270E|nr:MarC family protein [Acidomonas methanolica]MCQ9154762.1 MarC family protein [Acidomonas methanolica]
MMLTAHGVIQQAGFRYVAAAWLLAYPALFSIVNPFGAALIFAQVTMGRLRSEITQLSRLVAVQSFVVLIVSIWFGESILGFFGISIDALRVAGGLVVATRAWTMLAAPEENEARKERQAFQGGRTVAAPDLRGQAFFPLTMPFTVGPGSISVAIALSSERPMGEPMIGYFCGLTLAALSMALTIWVVYVYADRIVSALGGMGARIVSRLAALILLCIGVQITFSGVEGFVLLLARKVGLSITG